MLSTKAKTLQTIEDMDVGCKLRIRVGLNKQGKGTKLHQEKKQLEYQRISN